MAQSIDTQYIRSRLLWMTTPGGRRGVVCLYGVMVYEREALVGDEICYHEWMTLVACWLRALSLRRSIADFGMECRLQRTCLKQFGLACCLMNRAGEPSLLTHIAWFSSLLMHYKRRAAVFIL